MNKQRPEDILFLIHPHMQEEDSPLEAMDFRRMEERIQMTEETMETWKQEVEKKFQCQEAADMIRAFEELSQLTDLIDELYAEWIEMDELAPELSQLSKRPVAVPKAH